MTTLEICRCQRCGAAVEDAITENNGVIEMLCDCGAHMIIRYCIDITTEIFMKVGVDAAESIDIDIEEFLKDEEPAENVEQEPQGEPPIITLQKTNKNTFKSNAKFNSICDRLRAARGFDIVGTALESSVSESRLRNFRGFTIGMTYDEVSAIGAVLGFMLSPEGDVYLIDKLPEKGDEGAE